MRFEMTYVKKDRTRFILGRSFSEITIYEKAFLLRNINLVHPLKELFVPNGERDLAVFGFFFAGAEKGL